MSFGDIKEIAKKIKGFNDSEVNKNMVAIELVEPLLQELGYSKDFYGDIVMFPTIICNTTNGVEKIDASAVVSVNNAPVMVIFAEDKNNTLGLCGIADLTKVAEQLKCKVALLTNGADYKFYALDTDGKLDIHCYLKVNIFDDNAKEIFSNYSKSRIVDYDINDYRNNIRIREALLNFLNKLKYDNIGYKEYRIIQEILELYNIKDVDSIDVCNVIRDIATKLNYDT